MESTKTDINTAYELCQTGTQQSPIPLRLDQGLSAQHTMRFNYPTNVSGIFQNWGYGPAFTIDHDDDDFTTLPSITFAENGVNNTAYLHSWHIHSPADHTVQGDRSKAELHLVHASANGSERAVLAIRIDPGNAPSAFFTSLPALVGYNNTNTHIPAYINPSGPINEVARFNEFWTYKGSLTSPPCTEGLRWFVARQILFVSDAQMQAILRVSTYSARAEQEVWRHDINV